MRKTEEYTWGAIKAKQRVVKAQADVDVFAAHRALAAPTYDKYPAGVPVFKSDIEFHPLDLPYSKACDNDLQFIVPIPRHSTRRQTLQRVHWYFMELSRQCDLEALQDREKQLVVSSSKDAASSVVIAAVDILEKESKIKFEIHLGAVWGRCAQTHLRHYRSRCLGSVPRHLKLQLCRH